jgi:hypothetical protein
MENGKSGIAFEVTAETSREFLVLGKGVGRSVLFTVRGERINIKTESVSEINATLTLNNDGDCRFKVNGQELQAWQLSRVALEDLFFTNDPRLA